MGETTYHCFFITGRLGQHRRTARCNVHFGTHFGTQHDRVDDGSSRRLRLEEQLSEP